MPTSKTSGPGPTGLGHLVLTRLFAISLGTVVALALAELMLRLFGLAPVEGLATVSAAEYDEVPGIFSPNQDLVSRVKPALPHEVRIDSLGFRVTRETGTSSGPPTILYIGDSFTFGDFVDDYDALPAKLYAYLGAKCGTLRVINAGFGGTTIVDHLQVLRRSLRENPDIVLLQFSENDVDDLAVIPSLWDRIAVNRRRKSSFPLSVIYPAARNTALWNAGLKVLATARARRTAKTLQPPSAERQDSLRSALRDRYQEALYAFRDSVAAHDAGFFLAMYPSHYSVTAGSSAQLTWLQGVAEAGHIRSINLLPPLVESGLPTTSLFLLPHDGHPSAAGYGIVAPFLGKALEDDVTNQPSCMTQKLTR